MVPAPTARGDKEGRRRDVLDAAREILEESGWDGLGIREVASRAAVSTGAVYQWFSGKDEIFGELYDQRVRAGIELLDRIPPVGLEETVRMMVDWAIDLYAVLGTHRVEYVNKREARQQRVEAVPVAVGRQIVEKADEALMAAAVRDGVALTDDPHRITFIWATAVGVAERILTLPDVFSDPEEHEGFVAFASATLAAGLVVRDP